MSTVVVRCPVCGTTHEASEGSNVSGGYSACPFCGVVLLARAMPHNQVLSPDEGPGYGDPASPATITPNRYQNPALSANKE